MASPEWLAIYRTYSPEKLQAKIDELEKQDSVFTSQGVGSKNYVKNLDELRGKLASAIRVQQERGNPKQPGFGITDFGGIGGN